MSANAPSPNDCASLSVGNIRFYDNYVPTLPVGDYLINVNQQINPKNSSIDECHQASQVFSVQGPRYGLPADDIYSIFPANNANGIFNQHLPHVVLGNRDLPWERNVFDDPDPATQTPWMALLLFVDGEKIGGTDALLAPKLADWKANRTMTGIIPARDFYHHASGDGILWPALEPEWYESESFLEETSTTIIDISPQAFTTLVPSTADLRYLAHVRQVDSSGKENGILKINGEGWYSVIVGNRLPDAPPPGSGDPGKRNIVHLVSLEGFQDYASGRKQIPSGTTRVRMISLRSWSFTCLPQMGESFAQAMNGLLKDSSGAAKPTDFRLQVPPLRAPSPEETFAYNAIRNGYVPLRYHTRLGEQSFAWYRGPFSPIPVKNFVAGKQTSAESPVTWKPFGTASAAIVYDKEHGIFDPSYGVAWETGRMLALSDPQFGPSLRNWQQKGHHLVDMIIERQHQMAALMRKSPRTMLATTAEQMVDRTAPYALTDDLMVKLIADFPTEIAPIIEGEQAGPAPRSAPRSAADGKASTRSALMSAAWEDHPTPFADQKIPAPTPDELEAIFAPPSSRQAKERGSLLSARSAATVREAVRRRGTDQLNDLVTWLSQLYLLTNVPFESLVPHNDLLTPETVRFFHIDSNWLDVLVEGALSIGVDSSRDLLYQKLMWDLVHKGTVHEARRERRVLLGTDGQAADRPASGTPASGTPAFDQETLTGLLLRSSVVSGWPGLEIHAYTRTKPGSAEPDLSTHIELLRMERLSGDVMLCIWPAVPAVVTINEPHEGLAFGFQDPLDNKNGYWLYLRSVDKADYGMPKLPESTYHIDAEKGIIGPDRRIRITGSGGLLEAMRALLPGSPTINVRDFAVQMVKVPETAIFAAPHIGQEKA